MKPISGKDIITKLIEINGTLKKKSSAFYLSKEQLDEVYNFDTEKMITYSDDKKKIGNTKYTEEKKFDEAIQNYMLAILPIYFDGTNQSLKKILVDCLSNISLMLMMLKDIELSLQVCNEILIISPKHSKALHRRGDCYIQLNKMDLAKEDYKEAFENETSLEIQNEIRQKLNLNFPEYSMQENLMTENEYLATLSNIHWILYPFIKTLKIFFCCKRKKFKTN